MGSSASERRCHFCAGMFLPIVSIEPGVHLFFAVRVDESAEIEERKHQAYDCRHFRLLSQPGIAQEDDRKDNADGGYAQPVMCRCEYYKSHFGLLLP
jgi:hypothetical protein